MLLHGYGANGDDLIALAEGWRSRLPQAASWPQHLAGHFMAQALNRRSA